MPFQIRFLDVVDVILVALIIFQLYRLIRGTAAFSIFIAISVFYVSWLLVKALGMEMLSALLGQVMGVGVIALIIVFQQEVRRFLLVFGNRYMRRSRFSLNRFFPITKKKQGITEEVEEIVRACAVLAEGKIGGLLVIGRKSNLDLFTERGEIITARISDELLLTIFAKNTPLHDGAVLIQKGKILAARCRLPITDQVSLPTRFGMRHQAAIGMSEHTDALVVVVSEESGYISIAESGKIREDLTPVELREILRKEGIW